MEKGGVQTLENWRWALASAGSSQMEEGGPSSSTCPWMEGSGKTLFIREISPLFFPMLAMWLWSMLVLHSGVMETSKQPRRVKILVERPNVLEIQGGVGQQAKLIYPELIWANMIIKLIMNLSGTWVSVLTSLGYSGLWGPAQRSCFAGGKPGAPKWPFTTWNRNADKD